MSDGRTPSRRLRPWGAIRLAGVAVALVTFLLVLLGGGTANTPVPTTPGTDERTEDVESDDVEAAAPTGTALTDAPRRGEVPAPAAGPTSGTAAEQPLAGLRIALDPGHNGANARNPGTVNALVPDGRGGTKACNTVGASTDGGYPEHAFTWDVSQRTAEALEELGAEVVLTRDDDEGVGPCVDERGTVGQDTDADLVVSVHANGSTDRTVRGFFVILADPPVHEASAPESRRLAEALVVALEDAGFPPSSVYRDGVSLRRDLATLDHAERPAVLVELGEMRHPEEGGAMETPEGRQRYADALVAGVVAFAEADPADAAESSDDG